MAVTAPLGSSVSSLVVVIVYVVVALLIVTVDAPVAPKLPVSDTCIFTVIGVVGAGLEDMVNVAVLPSVIPLPPLIVITGVGVGGGGGESSSDTVTDADDAAPTV